MKTHTQNVRLAWQISLMVMLSAVIVSMPDFAFAAGVDTPIGNVLCVVTGWFLGNAGKGLATLAVTIVGIGALLGKVSWGMAMIVGIGVAIIFGLTGFINAMSTGVILTNQGAPTC
jgi:type IV secretory pathway VirB2 component (pilin)